LTWGDGDGFNHRRAFALGVTRDGTVPREGQDTK
jgi:hypothetical protein